MRLEDIKNCHVCGSNNLTPFINIPVPDIMTNEDVMRNVLMCDECETLHFIEENGDVSYEFSCRINEEIGRKVKR